MPSHSAWEGRVFTRTRSLFSHHFMRVFFNCLWIVALNSSLAIAAETEQLPSDVDKFVVRTTNPDNKEVPFYVRKPPGYAPGAAGKNWRVLFICPALNGDGLETITTTSLIKTATQENWFVVVPTFKGHGNESQDRKLSYYYPEKWSGKAVLEALELIKKKYPIVTDGMFMRGVSGGAQFVHRFAIWAPERVAAVVVNSSSWFEEPNAKSKQVAWLVTVGDSDPAYDETLKFVNSLREAGALPLFRSYIGMSHQVEDGGMAKINAAFLKFYDVKTREKLGVRKSLAAPAPGAIQPPMPAAAMPYVGDAQDWRYFKNTPEAAGDIPEDSRIYLASEEIARVWGEGEE